MKASVLRPGLLVSLKTSIRGGVNYHRTEIEPDHSTEDGARRARWDTVRDIPDAAEFERATQARGKARALVSSVCCASSFGMLCPSARAADLDEAVAEARKVAEEHNATARLTRLDVFVLVGRIAQDDAEAVRAVTSEVRELLDAMQEGIKAANPEAIREAANKARNLGSMLNEDVSGKVADAIAQARSAARELVKRVGKAGESAADVVKEINVEKISGARFAFLDLDQPGQVTTEAPAPRAVELPPAPVSAPHSHAQALPFPLEV